MATFLELCQLVGEESGTVAGGYPTTVVDQVGRLDDIVRWVNVAYAGVQTSRRDWLWMHGEYEKALTIGTRVYSGSVLSITRFRNFEKSKLPVTLYDNDIGASDEGRLIFVDYPSFYQSFMTGTNRTKSEKPSHFSLTPAGEIVLYPTPDKAYYLRGAYRKSAHVLVNDTDEPEMPEDFHEVIKWKALDLLGMYDEAVTQLPLWRIEYKRLLSELELSELPEITLGGALA